MRGGAENQLLVLAKQQIGSGQNVHVIYLKGDSELAPEFMDAGAIIHNQFANMPLLVQLVRIKKFLTLGHLAGSIIHAHLPRAQIIASLGMNKSQKLICSRHDEDQFYPKAKRKVSNLLFKLVDLRVEYWIAISEAVKAKMMTYNEMPRKANIQVVHYGYGAQFTKLALDVVDRLRLKYALNSDCFVIGCVARLVWQKNHETLLQAFALFQKSYPDAKLLLVGDGPRRTHLENLANSLSIEQSVIFAGKVNSVKEHLSLMDVFVLSSTTEGFGLVLLEAMEAGIPLISSDASALAEVIGKAGLLFHVGQHTELADKLKIMLDIDVQHRYSRLGKSRLGEFSPEIMWSKVSNIYEKAAMLK